MRWLPLFFLLLPGLAWADIYTINQLMVRLNDTLQDKQKLEVALNKGQQRAELCQHCHGKDGNSLRNYIPNLAEQNPRYLITQFEYFRVGKRKDYVMNNLAKTISEEDRVNLALFYSNQKVKTPSTQKEVSQGKAKFNQVCVSCHGQQGYGNEALPRIAGQPDEYIIKTLKAYRDRTRDRPDSPMLAIAATLSNEEIKQLADYVSSMK